MPAISIAIPTRDRPDFVRQALSSLATQEFTDFEVLVADNPVTAPCKDVVAEFGDERFRYRRASRPLLMHDNWEAGVAELTGEYIAVMIDKSVWFPSTLSRAIKILDETSASVLSWWDAKFTSYDEGESLTRGDYHAYTHTPPHDPVGFSGGEELAKALALSGHTGSQGPEYFRGKICFGLYRRDVLDRIRDRVGRVFPPICPDYTSRVGALATAPSFVDAGVPLQLTFMTEISNGRRVEREPQVAKRFLDEIDPGLMDRLPIPGVYTSPHNMIAHDYLLAERLGAWELDRRNLFDRAYDDLRLRVEWPSSKLRRQQYRLLATAERRAGRSAVRAGAHHVAVRLRRLIAAARVAPREVPYRALQRMPRVRRVGRIVLRKSPVPPEDHAVPDTLDGAIRAAEAQVEGPRRAGPRSVPALASPAGRPGDG